MTESAIDTNLITYAEGAAAYYEEVFGGPPEITFETLPGGDHAIVIESWIWVFYVGIEERWGCRLLPPADDPLFRRHEGLKRLAGVEMERPSWEEVLVWAFEKETHRRFAAAREDLPRRGAA